MQVLTKRLEAVGWEHRTFSSAVTPEALIAMRVNALVLDPSVVNHDGWGYLERICNRLPALALVVCTSPSSVAQRVRGLRLGADSWITKPCHPEELICVIEAILRRHRRVELAELEEPIAVGELAIRPDLHQVYVGDESVDLTSREFEILHLLSRTERVLRREEIYERVWGYAMAHGDRSVDVFVRKLRQKLRIASPRWSYIQTHFGVGYRLAPEPDEGVELREAVAPAAETRAGAAPAATEVEPRSDDVAPAPAVA
jgi:DNA-binding response OmpR family regulator